MKTQNLAYKYMWRQHYKFRNEPVFVPALWVSCARLVSNSNKNIILL